jgi:hypothetical protein
MTSTSVRCAKAAGRAHADVSRVKCGLMLDLINFYSSLFNDIELY